MLAAAFAERRVAILRGGIRPLGSMAMPQCDGLSQKKRRVRSNSAFFLAQTIALRHCHRAERTNPATQYSYTSFGEGCCQHQ